VEEGNLQGFSLPAGIDYVVVVSFGKTLNVIDVVANLSLMVDRWKLSHEGCLGFK
jgi:hypothetical protein